MLPQPSLFDGKVCSRCKQWAFFDNWPRDKSHDDGLRSECRKCFTIAQRARYLKYQERNLAHAVAYKAANKEKVKAAQAATYQKHREKRYAYARRYKDLYPEKIRRWVKAGDHRRRVLKKNAVGEFSNSEWLELCQKYDNRCLRCGEQSVLTVDHVVPLSKGGTNYIDNIQPLCLSCNSSKGTSETDYRTGVIPSHAIQYSLSL